MDARKSTRLGFFNEKNSNTNTLRFKNNIPLLFDELTDQYAALLKSTKNNQPLAYELATQYTKLLNSPNEKNVRAIAERRLQALSGLKPDDWNEFEKIWTANKNRCFRDKVILLLKHYHANFKSRMIPVLLDLEKNNWDEKDILNYFAANENLTAIVNSASPNGRMMNMIKFIEAKCLGIETNPNVENDIRNRGSNRIS